MRLWVSFGISFGKNGRRFIARAELVVVRTARAGEGLPACLWIRRSASIQKNRSQLCAFDSHASTLEMGSIRARACESLRVKSGVSSGMDRDMSYSVGAVPQLNVVYV